MAAKLGELENMKQLVSGGTDVDIKDDKGVSVIRVHLDQFQVVFCWASAPLLLQLGIRVWDVDLILVNFFADTN